MSGEKKFNILIADDEEGLRFSLASILEMDGYDVQTAGDGLAALELVKENDFDIAFFDIRMPGMNGVETLKKIKIASPKTIVVMMTAYAMNDLIKESVAEGAFACISKPFEIEDILNTVKEVESKRVALVLGSDVSQASETSAADFFDRNFKPCGFFVVYENDLNKALGFAKRRKPELIFLGEGHHEAASKFSSEAGSESKVILIDEHGSRQTGNSEFKCMSLSKAAMSEFLQHDGRKNAVIVSTDTISSNNLKISLVSKGYEVSVFHNNEEFFENEPCGIDDFVIADFGAVSDPEKFCSRIRANNAAGVIIFIFDYDSPVSEELKKLNVLFINRPFDAKDIIKLMEKKIE